MSSNMAKNYSYLYLLPAVVLFGFFFIIPNIASFFFGFTDWSIYYITDIHWNGLDNFRRMFENPVLIRALLNTFYFAFVTVIARNVLGLLLALAVNMKTRIEKYLRAAFFLPCLISVMVVGIIFGAIYDPYHGIINSFLRLIGLGSLAQSWLVDSRYAMSAVCLMDIWQWTGFSMVIYLAGLQSVPSEYYEAASIDGAGRMHKFWNITLPLIMPAISINIVLSVIGGLKVFGQVYALTNGGPADTTQVLGTYLYKSFGDGYLGYSSAIGLVMTLLVSIIALPLLRVLRRMEEND